MAVGDVINFDIGTPTEYANFTGFSLLALRVSIVAIQHELAAGWRRGGACTAREQHSGGRDGESGRRRRDGDTGGLRGLQQGHRSARA